MANKSDNGRFLTVEEQLAALDDNPIKIDSSDNSLHYGTDETKTGNGISDELSKGTAPQDLDPIPADAEAAEYREPTHFDNGVNVPEKTEPQSFSTSKKNVVAPATPVEPKTTKSSTSKK